MATRKATPADERGRPRRRRRRLGVRADPLGQPHLLAGEQRDEQQDERQRRPQVLHELVLGSAGSHWIIDWLTPRISAPAKVAGRFCSRPTTAAA